MEKLTRIQVSGFRSFRAIDTPLRALTVLIGANGSGKSNFVGLFDMLSFMLSGSLQAYIARKGGAVPWSTTGRRSPPRSMPT